MKKALLVGINYPGTPHALRGCVNDVMEMSQLLSSKYGFEAKNKRMLTDASATTKNILDRLEWLVADAKEGDVLYFHYSGHGSQFIDQDYDSDYEPDGKDEILCPIDLDWRTNIITDDDLRRIFNKVPEGVNLTIVLDCCHSGSGIDSGEAYETSRSFDIISGPNKNRYLAPPCDILNRGIGLDLKPRDKPIQDTAGVLISGCQSDQTSADAWIHNKYMGAATYYLIETLKTQNGYKKIVEEMNAHMKNRGYTQRPQLNGSPQYYELGFLEPLSKIVTENIQQVDNTTVTKEIFKEELQIQIDSLKAQIANIQGTLDLL